MKIWNINDGVGQISRRRRFNPRLSHNSRNMPHSYYDIYERADRLLVLETGAFEGRRHQRESVEDVEWTKRASELQYDSARRDFFFHFEC